ncbi:hypothetical protein IS481_11790 [Caldimonas thermodepolymerans]|nr:FimV/HubP family polar landmark protein [Caldimonas thermodepolymerans]QPC30452.1 hypothetical protein IS481_11790 [Caldimonas thermodepolymerans]RDI02966.1 pilus assembly protein FimV [Caldimonas thermodepolymerans]UZG43219.1 hypothetical protein ONZ46_12495 [Caldimonas thermodepolymerans]
MYLAVGNAAALGLGRLTVQSALGEQLRAEIDVTSLTPEEEANFRARIAGPDAYRAAGVEYNSALPGAQVTLERRPDGRPYLRIQSERVIQEPFVDVILELSWASGRLVREYTLLLDPPVTRQAAAPQVPPAMSSGAPAAASPAPRTTVPSAPPVARAPAPAASPAPAERRQASRSEPAPSAADAVDEYAVRRGDTLYGIASRVQRPGVSLDQMLVSLYRANPHAFIGDNMNRLKAGVVLNVPGEEEARSVSQSEARQIIQAQSADFAAYRQRLAGAVQDAGAGGPGREASGRVEASVEDRKAAAAGSPDRLTLSKGAVAAQGAATPSQEDQIARERERREVESRVAELSRNLQELQQISPSAAASAPAAAAPAPAASPALPGVQVPVAAPAGVTPPEPVAAAEPASAAPQAEAAAVAEAPASAEDTTATVAEAASAPEAAEVASATAPAAAPAPKPPVAARPEPSFVDELLDNPLLLPAAGGLVALLLGFGLYRMRSRSKKDSGETSFLESRLQPDSFFGASGGQRIDTKDASGAPSSLSYSLSQLDAIGDVDPVAEADVYLAYGRDLQAEEILKEAMRANPERLAIRTKLLEVYAKRRDTKGFELLATQLYGLTGGEGEDWAKAQELGQQIDPENPLYKPGGAPAEAQAAPGKAEPLGASTMPQSIMPTPSKFEEPPVASVDLDLDLPLPDTPAVTPLADPEVTKPLAPAPVAEAPAVESLDFSLSESADPAPAAASAGVQDLNMSFDLPEVAAAAPATADAQPSNTLEFDLGDISLDLDGVKDAARDFGGPSQPGVLDELPDLDLGDGDAGDPLARKLELAEEFRQIGDREGARELLQEVVSKSSGALKAKAQTMLAELA